MEAEKGQSRFLCLSWVMARGQKCLWEDNYFFTLHAAVCRT